MRRYFIVSVFIATFLANVSGRQSIYYVLIFRVVLRFSAVTFATDRMKDESPFDDISGTAVETKEEMSPETQWILDHIKATCQRYPRRSAGSENVRLCMSDMAEQLKAYSDSVEEEAFSLHPHAFAGSIPLQALCSIIGVICYWLHFILSLNLFAILSTAFFILAFLVFFLEFFLYRRAFDALFPSRPAVNVMAKRKAGKESRQQLIFCGHADAAYEMTFFLRFKAWLIYVLIVSAIAGIITCFIFGVLSVFSELSQQTQVIFGIIETIFLFAFIPWLFFVNWRITVDGANDNLTGCYIGMSLLKEMAENDERLSWTDVCCLITDGEESGLRGAMAYAERHRQSLIDSQTAVIAIDTIHDVKSLAIYHRGINFTQANSREVCDLLHQAGLACGIDLPLTEFYPGANDAEAFSRNGIKAAGICAVQHTPANYYHTRYDSWDNLNAESIEVTRNIMKAAMHRYDQSGGRLD